VWSSTDEIRGQWALDREWTPAVSQGAADQLYEQWQRAVSRSRGWAR
jgi:glycerol kinase